MLKRLAQKDGGEDGKDVLIDLERRRDHGREEGTTIKTHKLVRSTSHIRRGSEEGRADQTLCQRQRCSQSIQCKILL